MTNAVGDTRTDFWLRARAAVPALLPALPEAWAFGATADQADSLLQLVLDGTKTGTSSSGWDFEATGEPVPRVGELSIILDGAGRPRAVVECTRVQVVPFDQVDAEHAYAEGEGNRGLTAWREIHERYWRSHSEDPRGWAPDMPVVCERFRLVYREVPGRHSDPARPRR